MSYLISREELVKMINKEQNVGFKAILQNHLRIMDGEQPICKSCVIDDVVESIEEIEEE